MIIVASFPYLAAHSLQNYDIMNRFSLAEDKFLTHKMLSRSNDIFDMDIYLNKKFKNLIDKAKQAKEKQTLSSAQEILFEYDQTEQFVTINSELNVPLPTFRIGSQKVTPKWEMGLKVGSMISIFKQKIDFADLLEYVGNEVPNFIKEQLISCPPPDLGEDIVRNAIENNCISSLLLSPYLGKYFYPKNENIPQVFNYTKIETRLGSRFQYRYNSKFSGGFKLYWLGRSDFKLRITDKAIRNNAKLVTLPKKIQNSHLAVDHRLQYRNESFSTFLSIEELKISIIKQGHGLTAPIYERTPLLRWHTDYSYKPTSLFRIKTYLGTHYRKYYDPLEAFYIGIDLNLIKTKLQSTLRFQTDQEHFTFAPQFQFYWIYLEGLLKTPIKKSVNGIKLSRLWGLNFKMTI